MKKLFLDDTSSQVHHPEMSVKPSRVSAMVRSVEFLGGFRRLHPDQDVAELSRFLTDLASERHQDLPGVDAALEVSAARCMGTLMLTASQRAIERPDPDTAAIAGVVESAEGVRPHLQVIALQSAVDQDRPAVTELVALDRQWNGFAGSVYGYASALLDGSDSPLYRSVSVGIDPALVGPAGKAAHNLLTSPSVLNPTVTAGHAGGQVESAIARLAAR